MEKKLKALFDYQRFEGNAALAALIRETEQREAVRELSEDELAFVNAAGDPDREWQKLSMDFDQKD